MSLPVDARARRLVISRDDTILAERSAPGAPPRLQLEADALELGRAPHRLHWTAQGAEPLRHSVRYSSTGAAPWQALGVRRVETSLTIDPADLRAGPAPTLRVVTDDGFHHSHRDMALRLIRPPVPRLARAAQGLIALEFDTLVDAQAQRDRIQLVDADGQEVPFDLHQGARNHLLNLILRTNDAPGPPERLILQAGFSDVFGTALPSDHDLSVAPVGAPLMVAPRDRVRIE